MYNAELEKLMEMALMDGELTEKKKQILLKKAESFSIDLDEFEMVLDARVFEKIQQLQTTSQTSAVKTSAAEVIETAQKLSPIINRQFNPSTF